MGGQSFLMLGKHGTCIAPNAGDNGGQGPWCDMTVRLCVDLVLSGAASPAGTSSRRGRTVATVP
jgi:hypothetical protein